MMTSKVTVGFSEKRGLPNFGSIGASCSVELQLDSTVVGGDGEAFEVRMRKAFDACRRVVGRELQRGGVSGESGGTAAADRPPRANGSGNAAGNRPRAATAAQLRAVHALARKAGVSLADEISRQFGVRSPAALTIGQASALIDQWKQAAETVAG